jgi:drug/metabolite transporter (DMT)-like permease
VPLAQKVGILLSFIGVVCLTDLDISFQSSLIWGFGVGTIGALGYAMYVFLAKQMTMPPIKLTAWVCFGASLFFLTQSFYTSTLKCPSIDITFELALFSILCTVLPILLLIRSVQLIGTIKASLATVFEPATTMIIGAYFLAEHFSALQYVGFILMVLSLCVVEGVRMYQKKISPAENMHTPAHSLQKVA